MLMGRHTYTQNSTGNERQDGAAYIIARQQVRVRASDGEEA